MKTWEVISDVYDGSGQFHEAHARFTAKRLVVNNIGGLTFFGIAGEDNWKETVVAAIPSREWKHVVLVGEVDYASQT